MPEDIQQTLVKTRSEKHETRGVVVIKHSLSSTEKLLNIQLIQ